MSQPGRSATARILGEVAVASALLGGLLALGWVALAPDIYAEVTEAGWRLSRAQQRQQFGIEAWFGLLAGLAGSAAGVVLFRRHRHHPVTVQLALVVCGVGGSVLGWQLGRRLGPGDLDERAAAAAVGSQLDVPLEIHAYGMLLVWPVIAAIAAVSVAALLDDHGPWRRPAVAGSAHPRDPGRRRGREPDQVSW
jgi:hypothetical protein